MSQSAIRAVKTEQRCKLCRSGQREAIDQWILRRSNKEKDEAGRRINLEYVLEKLGELGIENPTEENVKVHLRKHCEIVPIEEVQADEQRAQQTLERFLSGDRVDVEEALKAIVSLGAMELELKLQETGRAGVTVDQMISAANALAKRKTNEAASELLRTTSAAIGAAVAAGELNKRQALALEPPIEAEEGEVTELVEA